MLRRRVTDRRSDEVNWVILKFVILNSLIVKNPSFLVAVDGNGEVTVGLSIISSKRSKLGAACTLAQSPLT